MAIAAARLFAELAAGLALPRVVGPAGRSTAHPQGFPRLQS